MSTSKTYKPAHGGYPGTVQTKTCDGCPVKEFVIPEGPCSTPHPQGTLPHNFVEAGRPITRCPGRTYSDGTYTGLYQ